MVVDLGLHEIGSGGSVVLVDHAAEHFCAGLPRAQPRSYFRLGSVLETGLSLGIWAGILAGAGERRVAAMAG